MYVVKDGDSYRVVGFVPGEYLREGAYISAVLLPKRLLIKVGNKELPAYADILALTLDKQRRINRAFVVSEKFEYSGEKKYTLLIFKGNKVVGKIFGRLKLVNPHIEIVGIEKTRFKSFWHVYIKLKAVPAARNYPLLIGVHDSRMDTFFPVERSPFLTKYTGWEEHKYQGWYDYWIFSARFKSEPDVKDYRWIFKGDIFGDSL